MNHSTAPRAFPALVKSTVIAVGCILGLAALPAPTTRAGESDAVLRPLDDSLPALPLSGDFAKADGDNGPYGLTLKNTSGNPVKASGTVRMNVTPDASTKVRQIAGHVIERAETWTIYGLSSGDKVTIEADGFAPLTLTVP
jgi:hypothetical protein